MAESSEQKQPSTAAEPTFQERLKENPSLYAAVIVPVLVLVVGVVAVVVWWFTKDSGSNTPQFLGFNRSTGSFCKPTRYRYRLPDPSTAFSNWSVYVGGPSGGLGTEPKFSSPANSALSGLVWQRQIQGTTAVNVLMARIGPGSIWVDDTVNPCTSPGLEFDAYQGDALEGYQCAVEYPASYYSTGGPWSTIIAVVPPPGVVFPGRPQFRVPGQPLLPTSLSFERRPLGTSLFDLVNMTSVPTTGNDSLFRDNTVGPCGGLVLRNVRVREPTTQHPNSDRFYITRSGVTWFYVKLPAGSYPLNELFSEVTKLFADSSKVTIESDVQDPREVQPKFIENVRFEYLVQDRVRASVAAPTNFDGTNFPGPGTDAGFRVTTSSGAATEART